MDACVNENLKNRNFVSYIDKSDCGCECEYSGMRLYTYNLKTNKEVNVQKINDLDKLLTNPPAFIKEKVKAIIITNMVFQNAWDSKAGIQERLSISKKLKKLNIPFSLILRSTILHTSILNVANVDLKLGETVMIIMAENEKTAMINTLIRKVNGYYFQDTDKITINPDDLNVENTRNKIFETSNPTKIFLSISHEMDKKFLKHIRASLKSKKNVTVLEHYSNGNTAKNLREIVKHMYDKNENKFFIIPESYNVFGISTDIKDMKSKNAIIANKKYDELPFSKTIELQRDVKNLYLTIFNKTTKIYHHLSEYAIAVDKCHRIKATLLIDMNVVPSIQIKGIIMPEIQNLPKKLNPKNVDRIPIIGFFDNSSVICIWNKDKNGYEFSKLWNGMYGKNLFLDFSYEKPKLVESVNPSTSTFVVYDILKIISMSVEALKNVDYPDFKITKDDENPVLLEFDAFEETRKAASPAFLMALLLKQHKKIIRKETGEKPTKFGFCIFSNFENFEDTKRVEDGLAEACRLLKMGFAMVENMA